VHTQKAALLGRPSRVVYGYARSVGRRMSGPPPVLQLLGCVHAAQRSAPRAPRPGRSAARRPRRDESRITAAIAAAGRPGARRSGPRGAVRPPAGRAASPAPVRPGPRRRRGAASVSSSGRAENPWTRPF